MTSVNAFKITLTKYTHDATPIWDAYWDTILTRYSDKTSWEWITLSEYKRMMSEGKHLRAFLVIFGYALSGHCQDKAISRASLSVEAIHNAFLIHDDIVDKSAVRRNHLTTHKLFEQKAINVGFDINQSKDIGLGTALNIGDVGQALAQSILIESGFCSDVILSCIGLFNENLWHTVMGQLLDIQQIQFEQLTEAQVEKIQINKTAYYSFVLPLLMGFKLGRGDSTYETNLTSFALLVGIIFQIQDDLLGVFGDEEEIGKSIDSDIREGKKTLLIVSALKNLPFAERQELISLYGTSDLSITDVMTVRKLIKQSNAVDYCHNKITRLVASALDAIEPMALTAEQKTIINGLVFYVGQRRY